MTQISTPSRMFAKGLLILSFVLVCHMHAGDANAIDISTDASSLGQRFEAWGTSLAWLGNEIGGQSNSQTRTQMMDLLFDQDNGLGLNFVRYNIGAGSNPDTSVQNITRPGAKMEGWVPDDPNPGSTTAPDPSTWVWDWNADATQRLILDMAIERGVTQVEAFANSAPWWMTRNEKSNGTSGGGSNLSTARNDDFAHYMLEVVDHFESNLGIHFETLAPMNEPGSGFWNGNSNQEGMGVPAGFYQDRLIKQFGTSIAARGTDIKLVGLEETSTDQSADSWTNGSLSSEAKAHISQVNTHTYGFNGGSLQSDSERLFDAVNDDGLGQKIYATEYGTGQGGVRLATQINRDIRYLNASGWTYWQVVEDNNGSGWGLMLAHFNGNNSRFDVQDQYFTMKQFSAHIRPGSQIIELTGQENITAAYDPRTGTTAVVVTNDGADSTSEQYNFDLLDRQAESTRLIRTTDENNSLRTNAYESLGAASVSGGTNVAFDTVGNSVTTLVIHHRPNLVQNANFDLGGQANGAISISHWQSDGNAAFDTGSDHSSDGSGTGRLETNSTGNSGRLFQTGIGDADTDLSGVAFQLSADVRFLNAGSRNYDAETYLALEFYGADDQTLASVSLNEYQTEIEPAPGVKRNNFESSVDGSDPNDNQYRTYQSGRFVAPAGTRYVRPVIRFDNVHASSTDFSFIDNVYLGEVHPEAAAREWNSEAGGTWSDHANWLNNSIVENNKQAYFGNAITQDSIVTVDGAKIIEGLTLFSEHEYQLQGTGSLFIGGPSDSYLVDVRLGSHQISVDTLLIDALDLQVLPEASLSFNSALLLNGHTLTKLGGGQLDLSAGFKMNSGQITSYTTTDALISLGSDALLDGDFELLLAPGQTLELGDTFELVAYDSIGDTFDNLLLPSLESSLAWDIDYGVDALVVEVVSAGTPGDFNDDGIVDAADYTHWRDNLGGPESVLNGNGDGSSIVDASDYALWKSNFGVTAASSFSTNVPEPASYLLCLALATFMGRRQQRA